MCVRVSVYGYAYVGRECLDVSVYSCTLVFAQLYVLYDSKSFFVCAQCVCAHSVCVCSVRVYVVYVYMYVCVCACMHAIKDLVGI